MKLSGAINVVVLGLVIIGEVKLESRSFDEFSYVSRLNETLEQLFVAHSQALENAFQMAEPSQQSKKLLNQRFVDSVQA